MDDIRKPLGINVLQACYVSLLPDQNITEELIECSKLVKSMLDNSDVEELKGYRKRVEFINYGDTQLVFAIVIDESRTYALLINQPTTEYGVGKREYDNLIKLNQMDSELVIKPIHYYERNKRELYVTPYYDLARCVGIEEKDWGVWEPEPSYHFRKFTDEERKTVNQAMVASLIKLYDEENNLGIANCVLTGGDFMLLKGYEDSEISFENIMNSIKLIAARRLISISLEDYIDRIRIELSEEDIPESELVILKSRIKNPFTKEEIETGIELGLSLRNNRKNTK